MILWNTLSTCLLVTSFIAGVESAHNNTVDELLEWFRSKGGYFNPKQEIRQDKKYGSLGVFAVQDIEQDELLTTVPWECVIRAEGTDTRFGDCATVKVLAEEMKKDVKSPYVKSLEIALQTHAQLPMNWSPRGKELLLQVTGNGVLPPTDFLMNDFEWKHECEQVSKDATSLIMTHGEELGMSPVSDKYNHAGFSNAYYSDASDYEMKPAAALYARYRIKAGQQIFTDYKEGYDISQPLGTAELLEQYGFVESYPRRFIFRDPLFAFDIGKYGGGDLQVIWLICPNDEAVTFIEEQLVRLKSVYLDLQQQSLLNDAEKMMPPNELEVITQYCTALITAMEHALRSIPVAFDGIQCTWGELV